ncbi:MAG TPA: hypothetical protein VG842_01740, partial [Sediminibacterium sp.]|nr:hypothetical protein [Sediminibacterium sp.]
MPAYDNLLEALADLKKRGFTTDFNLTASHLQCSLTGLTLSPDAFEIVEHYRFEANTDPDDASVLYAIQATDGSLRGTLVNAYGTYSDETSDELIQRLQIHE